MTSILDKAMSITWDANQEDAAATAADVKLAEDRDADGVDDETEAWLGTSALTDETGPDGRTDAGYTASVDRVQRALEADQTFPRFSDEEEDKTSTLSVLERGPRTFEGSAIAIRCAELTAEASAEPEPEPEG